jgi:hypothetical protein
MPHYPAENRSPFLLFYLPKSTSLPSLLFFRFILAGLASRELVCLPDGNGKIRTVELTKAAPGTLFHMGWKGHIHSLGVEILGEDDGLPGAEMHADSASLAKFLIDENLATFHHELLIDSCRSKSFDTTYVQAH